ncbi:MAG: respiratory chain complex I subunit 1 family protein [Thiohalospira sp.]
MAEQIFYFLIYPGLLFAAVIGAFLSWYDRKVTAWVQFRKGPPLLQPFYDFFKLLLVKETILPKHGAKGVFLAAPVFAVFGASIAGVFILLPLLGIETGFKGDIIVIFYLLTIPSLTYIIGALASGNPLAAVGGSREMKLILSYELTFLLVIAAIIYKSGMQISFDKIIAEQKVNGAFAGSISGIILFIVKIFCIQAKLALVPFDQPEAETEIADGIMIEYSGTPYAMIKLAKYIMFFILPAFLIGLLWGGLNFEGINILWSVLKILFVVLLLTLIRNTNPRVKIKQAVSFFMVWMNLLAIIAIVLTYFGY